MATNPTALAAQQLTGVERTDVDTRLLEDIKQLVSGGAQPGAQPAAPGPLKLKLPNAEGNLVEYTFENVEQLNAGLIQTLNNFKSTLAEVSAQAAAAPPPVAEPDPAKGFSKEKFLEIAGEDPRAGINYILSHGAFDGKTDDAFGQIKRQAEDLAAIKQQLAVFQFREQHPEVGGPQHAQLLDKIREEIGIPRENPVAWEASLAVARERGLLPTVQQLQAHQAQLAAQHAAAQQAGPYVQSPIGRSPGGANSGQLSPQFLAQAELLPTDKLEELIRSYSAGR